MVRVGEGGRVRVGRGREGGRGGIRRPGGGGVGGFGFEGMRHGGGSQEVGGQLTVGVYIYL